MNQHLKEIEQLAKDLMKQYGLHDWTFVWDNAKTRMGVCNPKKKQIGLSRLLSERRSLEGVKNTILHEIAHAKVGASHGHDRVWRNYAISIGCTGKRCSNISSHEKIKGKWEAVCELCKEVHYKYRKPKGMYSCGCSSKRFNPNSVLVFKESS